MADGLEFAVLGPVTVRRDGNPIALDTQQRALLAALLVAFRTSSHRTAACAGAVHRGSGGRRRAGRGRPRSARRLLEGLQQRLEAGAAEGERVLVRDGTRVQLLVDPDALDSRRFVAEVRRGDAMVAAAPDAAADAYREGCGCGGASPMRGSRRRPSPKRVHRNRSVSG